MAVSKRARESEAATAKMVNLKISEANRRALKFIAAMSGRRLFDVTNDAIVAHVRSFEAASRNSSKRARK